MSARTLHVEDVSEPEDAKTVLMAGSEAEEMLDDLRALYEQAIGPAISLSPSDDREDRPVDGARDEWPEETESEMGAYEMVDPGSEAGSIRADEPVTLPPPYDVAPPQPSAQPTPAQERAGLGLVTLVLPPLFGVALGVAAMWALSQL